jgi:hypothetical protein
VRFRVAVCLFVPAVVFGLLWMGPTPPPARAQGFFQQSPGPLTKSHTSLEGQSNCDECHTKGKELSNEKCLTCHDHQDMAARIRAGKGFHVSDIVAGKACWLCHSEHKGLGHDVMGWASIGREERFDHRWAGWPLTGAHAQVKCDKCHLRKNKAGIRIHLAEKSACIDCHAKDDPHKIRNHSQARCDRCHTTQKWKTVKSPMDFDHDRDTKYPLEAKHRNVECVKCHEKNLYSLGGSFDCVRCHSKENPHGGMLFNEKRCADCHDADVEWKKIDFDHNRRTKFDLDGAHVKVACYGCHKKNQEKKPERVCTACHEDVHKARFKELPSCETCHSTVDWSKTSRFDHKDKANWALTGKHAVVLCRKCHRGESPAAFEKFQPKTPCMGCHAHTNVHKKQFRNDQCLSCHKMPGVKQSKEAAVDKFHGPASSFPLDGGHRGVACVKCHPSENDFSSAPKQCGPQCHKDELHKGSLGPDCQRCHEGGRWPAVDFSHNDDASWKLEGEHVRVACISCHPQRKFKPTPKVCAECHREDDVHKGALGNKCEACHVPSAKSTFNHNTQSRFKLEGKHAKATCAQCHPDVRFKPRPVECVGCHVDVHEGRYGKRCEQCHNVTNFKTVTSMHDVGNFSLGGAHDRVPCETCHKDSRPLRGTGELCVTCHRSDDIHHNSLGPRCGECHIQQAFLPARFYHANVGCDLRGVHRTLPCIDCHKGGNYLGLVPECVACHRADAIVRGGVIPNSVDHTTQFTCTTCHNPNYWVPAFKGGGRESVCR